MKKNHVYLVALLGLAMFINQRSYGQKVPCPVNLDWELGDTTGWDATYGGGPGPDTGGVQTWPVSGSQTVITTPYYGFVNGRHTITNATMPVDPYGGFPVVAPGGGNHSLKLGDDNTLNGAESVSFFINVPPGLNTFSINYLYAVVLQDANHDPWQQPRFTLTVTDSATGIPLKDSCYDQNYVAAAGLPGFFTNGIVRYKPWTKAILNISGTAGKTVKLTITTGDCSASGHFGYGYFDLLDCGEFKAIIASCNQDRDGISLTAPEGYMIYDWYDETYTNKIDTGQTIKFFPTNTTVQRYNAILTPYPSVSDCLDTLTSVPLGNILVDPTADTACMAPGTPILLSANAQGGSGPLSYVWTETIVNNSLSCYTCASPTANAGTSNYYTVKVSDTNNCFRTRTINIGINENSIDAIDDFVLCHPGYVQLTSEAKGPLPYQKLECAGDGTATCTSPVIYEVRTLHREPNYKNNSDSSSFNNPFAAQFTTNRLQYLLKKEDLYFSGLRYGILSSLGLKVADAGNATYENFTISLGCTDDTQLINGFIPNTIPVFTGTVTPNLGWNDFTFNRTYNFDTSKNLVVDICFSNPAVDTPAVVDLLITTGLDAASQYSTLPGVSLCQGAGGIPEGGLIFVNRPYTRLGYCKPQDRPFDYTWEPGNYLSDSTIFNPLAYVDKTVKYYVSSIGASDCKVIDSVTITVPIHDYDIFPKDTSVCVGQPFQLTATGTFSSVRWFEYNKET
ncbi:MAG TPA: hypothetical protein VL098_15100, partial [Flavipsychrobacter sp.]|nr:hypothetical protein [Flavipsychrobacter sp.]